MLYLYMCILAVARALALPIDENTATEQNEINMGLRTLIVGSDADAIILPENVVQGYGAPYDVIVGAEPRLDGQGWHSIVVADSGVSDAWVREYAMRTHARLVFLQSIDRVDDGTVLAVESIPAPVSNVTVANAHDAQILAGVLNTTSSWNISETVPSAVLVLNSSMTTPFLIYDSATTVNKSAVAAFVANTTLGTEEMHFRFHANQALLEADFNPMYSMPTEFTQTNLALGHSWFEWVTRGVFLGYRRLALNIHVDDWFINSGLLYTGESYRINGSDVETYVAWRKNLHEKVLPVGSDFKLEPAFNGAGIGMTNYTDNGLLSATYTHAGEFNWVSHTWTHMNMDWLEGWECDGKEKTCNPQADHYDAELSYNQRVVRGEGIASDQYIPLYFGDAPTPAHQFLDNRTELLQNNWSPASLVTPEISGLWPASYNGTPPAGRKPYLKNSLFFSKLVEHGIQNVVGDNSRPELNNDLLYHGVFSTVEEYGVDGIFIIPRWSPNLPFNCNSHACIVRYYQEGASEYVLYGRLEPNRTWDAPSVINREAKAATIPLLQQRWDPYMFHQGNVHAQPYRNGSAPLVGQFVQEAAEDVLRYITGLPFVSVKMDDLAVMYRERIIRDDASPKGFLRMDATGQNMSIVVSGSSAFNSVVTITNHSPLSFGTGENVTVYGPDATAFKPVTLNQTAVYQVTGTLI